MAYGVTDEGFEAKRLDAILEDKDAAVQSVLGTSINLTPQSPDGQINGLLADMEADLWNLLEEVYNAFNPNAASGASLDNLVAVNGITRQEATQSLVTLTASGTNGTVLPTGAQVQSDDGDVFEVYLGATITAGTATLLARAVEYGPIAAAAGSVTSIVSPIFGWDSVTNASDATPGVERESDAELRTRRNNSVSFPGQSMIDSIYSGVADVDGVERVVVVENDSDATLGSGQTPHSIRCIIAGGVDADVAQAIFEEKAAGIEAYGDTIVPVLDSQGYPHDIGITRPTDVPIYIDIALTTFADYPADGDDRIKQAIVDYAAGALIAGEEFNLGDDIIYTRLYTPINSVPGHQIDHLWVSKVNPPTIADQSNIVIADDEVGEFLTSYITVT